ncbi:helix-turn-helix transcriptional regulator [Chondrinema litorale]|uniref:helix-turn-helix transcriptional regulator n=1 Tax=Chondrinema litorale TaxID=2994555 RepID=UPI002543EE92|nr:WYL domain-containing protein [Chondrinema litorale]UZR99844.1 WYL domain-containing protein [Chondrinema litorale]
MTYIEKIISLLRILSQENGASIDTLTKDLDLSPNRIYQNIRGIEKAGIEVIKDKVGFRRIRKEQLLATFNMTTKELQIIDVLKESIRKQKCIYIKEYSDSKGNVETFKVEPVKLFDNNRRIWVFDVADYQHKQFKLSRIGKLENSETPVDKYRHIDPKIDVFGSTGKEFIEVSFLLTDLACHLIKETYPESFKNIFPSSNKDFPFKFQAFVTSFWGVGRYILGMPGHIIDIKPISLLEHIKTETKKAYYFS